MKALTLTQPWATLVVRGIKRFETRSWHYNPWHQEAAEPSVGSPNRYDAVSGLPIPLAIHAAKGQDRDARDFAEYLVRCGVLDTADLPRGAIVGMVTYVRWHWSYPETRAEIAPSDLELHLGDWSDHRVLWEFADPREFAEPIPYQGSLGIWEWRAPDDIGPEAAIGEPMT